MLIVYSGFNTFINFPVFSVLLDPFYKIPFFFHTSGLEYPTRGGIKHLLVLTNDISPTKLNSIHHKVVINTNRVKRIDSTDYNESCNCEMRWDEDGDGADVGDDVDDDIDDARDDDDDDDDDLPFREVISPAKFARRR